MDAVCGMEELDVCYIHTYGDWCCVRDRSKMYCETVADQLQMQNRQRPAWCAVDLKRIVSLLRWTPRFCLLLGAERSQM